MITFTAAEVRRFAPTAKAPIVDALVDSIDEINAAGIDTYNLLHRYMAEIAHESQGFTVLEENLNYTAARLTAVWPSRFPTVAAAKPYAFQPKKLANKVYGGRLGNKLPNDGWDYRGGSLIQTTGRDNYRKAGHEFDPDTLRTNAKAAVLASLKFWTDNKLNAKAAISDPAVLRKAINGGHHGLDQVRTWISKARSVFTGRSPIVIDPDLSRDRVKELQQTLKDIGYVKVGNIDGWIGRDTIGAISAFQAEHGLQVNGRFDTPTIEALDNAQPLPIPASRAGTEPEKSRILKQSGLLKKGAVGILSTAGLGEVIEPLSSNIELVGSTVAKVKLAMDPLKGVISFLSSHPILLVVAAAGAVLLAAHLIEKARIEDHRTGKTA